MQLKHRTRGDLPPQGKKYLFVHAAQADTALRDQTIERILAYERGLDFCLWYSDDPQEVFAAYASPEMRSMLVFVPLVSDDYLALCKAAGAGATEGGPSFLERLQHEGVAVMPLFERAESVLGFTRLFGDMHGIFLSSPDADRLIEAQLGQLLPDGELSERITQEAFSGSLFLS